MYNLREILDFFPKSCNQEWQYGVYVDTVRCASIFARKYGTLVRYAFFVMVQVRYGGTLFEMKISDFSHIASDFCMQRQGLREKIFLGVRRSIPGPQILLGPKPYRGPCRQIIFCPMVVQLHLKVRRQ